MGACHKIFLPAPLDFHAHHVHIDCMETGKAQTEETEMTDAAQTQIDAAILAIAKGYFIRLDTLATRHSESLDYHEVHVGAIRNALKAAFKAGQASK